MKLFSKLSLNLEKTEITLKQQEKNALIRKQWTLLAKIADRLLLYFFILITLFLLGLIMNTAPNAKFI